MSAMTIPVAQLFALLLGSILHGIFFTLFVLLILLLSHSSFPSRFHRNLLIPVACIMMLLSTAYLVLSFIRIVQAFVPKNSETLADPDKYYSNFAQPLQTAKSCVFIAQTLLGDGVMIWRCYVVFNHNKIILFLCSVPLIANLVFGVLGSTEFIRHTGNLLQQSRFYLQTYIALTLVVNNFCCLAVVYRIWRSSKEMQAFRRVFPLVSAIIQSGALYTTAILAALVSYAVGSSGVYTSLDVIVPLVGIVFSLIVLQIHFHLSCHSLNNNNINNTERTSNLPTIGTLPRWRHFLSSAAADHQCQLPGSNMSGAMSGSRYQTQHSPIYSGEDVIDIDRISLSSDLDTRIKEGSSRVSSER